MTALGRYYVARDQALEAGDEAGVRAADLGLEMVHRAPEEWELDRVTIWQLFSRWPVDSTITIPSGGTLTQAMVESAWAAGYSDWSLH